jgi:hypothetical protein
MTYIFYFKILKAKQRENMKLLLQGIYWIGTQKNLCPQEEVKKDHP